MSGTQQPNFHFNRVLKMSIDLVLIFCLSIDRGNHLRSLCYLFLLFSAILENQEQHQITSDKKKFLIKIETNCKEARICIKNVLLVYLPFSAAVLDIIKRLYDIINP